METHAMKCTRAAVATGLLAISLVIGGCSKAPDEAKAPATEKTAEPKAAEAKAEAAEEVAAPTGEPGNINVTVAFEGEAPKRTAVDRTADPYCAKTKAMSESVIVNANGTLKNVAVYLKKVKGKYDVPAEPVKLTQSGCTYAPHVQVARKGQGLEITNDDKTLHNVHSYKGEKKKNWFNIAQPAGAPARVEKLKKAGLSTFKCDVHPWMSAYVISTPHPFAGVSGDDGLVALAGVPSKAKAYKVLAWHELFGTQEAEVVVEAGKTAELKVTFKAN